MLHLSAYMLVVKKSLNRKSNHIKIVWIKSNVLKSTFESFMIKINSFLICAHEHFAFQNSYFI